VNEKLKMKDPVHDTRWVTMSFVKTLLLIYLSTSVSLFSKAQLLAGFTATGSFNEQEMMIRGRWKNVLVNINAPLQYNHKGKTYLVFYALPNGNSIEWTKGKKIKAGDDWHFDIQHIAAQTRYVRDLDKRNNYIVAYLMAEQKSWPVWKRTTPDSIYLLKKMIDSITDIFKAYAVVIVFTAFFTI